MTINAAIKYYGGKGNMLPKLLPFFPLPEQYDTFIDCYGGSGVVLLNKPRAPVEIFNDLDANVYSLMKVLSEKRLFEQFADRASLALYDEMTSDEYVGSLRADTLSTLERAYRFWYVQRTRRSGAGGFSVNTIIRRKMSKSIADMLGSVDRLSELHERWRTVIVVNKDALALLEQYDRSNVFFYLDPPYVHEARVAKKVYALECDDAHHRALVETLNRLQHAQYVLSGYQNSIYEALNARMETFTVNTVSGTGSPKQKIETIWTNVQRQQLALF